MFRHLHTHLGQFRLVSFAEGLSYILLLFIAMPLKYWAGLPMAVRIVGSLHGFLFVLFVVFWVRVWFRVPWRPGRALLAFIAAMLPFGAFFLDRSLENELRRRYESAAG